MDSHAASFAQVDRHMEQTDLQSFEQNLQKITSLTHKHINNLYRCSPSLNENRNSRHHFTTLPYSDVSWCRSVPKLSCHIPREILTICHSNYDSWALSVSECRCQNMYMTNFFMRLSQILRAADLARKATCMQLTSCNLATPAMWHVLKQRPQCRDRQEEIRNNGFRISANKSARNEIQLHQVWTLVGEKPMKRFHTKTTKHQRQEGKTSDRFRRQNAYVERTCTIVIRRWWH